MSISEKVRNKTLTREDLRSLTGGDDVNRLEDGNTPLGYAVLNGDVGAIRLLLEHKASVRRKSANGLSVLHMAVDAKANAARIIKILLQTPGIVVDEEDESYPHDTPLMRALKNNPDPEIVKVLRDYGASATAQNSKGESAESIADRLVNTTIKEALDDEGNHGASGTPLVRFIVASAFLLLSYLKPRKRVADSVMSAFKMIYDELVKPTLAPPVPRHPTTKKELESILDEVIASQGLESFFPPGSDLAQDIVDRAHTVVNDPGLAFRLTSEEVSDQFRLAMYQPIIYCDDSGSMAEENRWPATKEIVNQMAETMLLFSPEEHGVHLRFINREQAGLDNLKGDALGEKMNFTPTGSTQIGTRLGSKVLKPFIYDVIDKGVVPPRPFMVIIITDGMPKEEATDTMAQAIAKCSKAVADANYAYYTARFSVSQVGQAAEATDFLNNLQAQSKQPELQKILHVTTDKLDVKYNELRENRRLFYKWIKLLLTSTLGTI